MAGRIIQGRPIDGSTGTVASSSAGGPIRVTLTAPTGNKRHHIHQLVWSVDAAPSSQTLTVYDGSTTADVVLQFEIGSSGHDTFFLAPLRTSPNTAATIVMSSGSAGSVYLNVFAYVDD